MNLLFSFFGRVGRGGFWLGVLCALLATLIASAIAYFVFGPPFSMIEATDLATAPATTTPADPDLLNAKNFTLNYPSIAVIAAGYVIGIWISLATQAKRCHDRGFTAWWLLLQLIPIAGGIWALVSLGILEGQEGPNQYGPDPRQLAKT